MFIEKLEGELDNGVKFELIVKGEDLIEVLKQRNSAFRRIIQFPEEGLHLTQEFMDKLEKDDLERSWNLPTKGE